MIFGDNPSGEIFYVDADKLPNGGQAAIRQVLFNDNGTRKTLLQLIGETNTKQKREPAGRADLRFGEGPQRTDFCPQQARRRHPRVRAGLTPGSDRVRPRAASAFSARSSRLPDERLLPHPWPLLQLVLRLSASDSVANDSEYTSRTGRRPHV